MVHKNDSRGPQKFEEEVPDPRRSGYWVRARQKFEKGKGEKVDSKPVAAPTRITRGQSLVEQMQEFRRIAREEASRYAEEAGYESFEEADDLDVDDDDHPLPGTPYENDHDPSIRETNQAIREARERRERSERESQASSQNRPTSSSSSSQPQGEGEGGEDPSPEPGSSTPAGVQRVRGYFRRSPEDKSRGD